MVGAEDVVAKAIFDGLHEPARVAGGRNQRPKARAHDQFEAVRAQRFMSRAP